MGDSFRLAVCGSGLHDDFASLLVFFGGRLPGKILMLVWRTVDVVNGCNPLAALAVLSNEVLAEDFIDVGDVVSGSDDGEEFDGRGPTLTVD